MFWVSPVGVTGAGNKKARLVCCRALVAFRSMGLLFNQQTRTILLRVRGVGRRSKHPLTNPNRWRCITIGIMP